MSHRKRHDGEIPETLGEASRLSPERHNQRQDSTPICSICLGELNFPVDTNCGHSFCAQCILEHWHHDRHPLPCHCPICRRDVTLLLCLNECTSDNSTLYNQVMDYNNQMRDVQSGVISRLRDVPMLIQHLRRDMFRLRGRLPVCSQLYLALLGLAVLIYVISPIDLIPEGIFGILGIVDDVFVVVYMVLYATNTYRTYIYNLSQEQN